MAAAAPVAQGEETLSVTVSVSWAIKQAPVVLSSGAPGPPPEERALARVSKDGPGPSCFETALTRLLCMRDCKGTL